LNFVEQLRSQLTSVCMLALLHVHINASPRFSYTGSALLFQRLSCMLDCKAVRHKKNAVFWMLRRVFIRIDVSEECRFLQEPHGLTSQKTAFLNHHCENLPQGRQRASCHSRFTICLCDMITYSRIIPPLLSCL
jgi:hypothetical protein